MKLQLDFYKSTGKWYTRDIVEIEDLDSDLISRYPYYTDMDYTVHIIASDGVLQPYRLFKR
jgi:hypothetical protein